MTQRRKNKKGSNLNCRPELLSIHFSACCLLLHCFCFQAQTISPKQISNTLSLQSLPFIHKRCIPEWMNRAYRCTCRESAARAHAVLQRSQTETWKKRGQLIWHYHPALPLVYSPPVPLSVTVSSLIHLFIPCLSPQSNSSASSCLAVIMSASNCLIPARGCTWERGRHDLKQAICERVFIWNWRRISAFEGRTILSETNSYWHVSERDEQPTSYKRTKEPPVSSRSKVHTMRSCWFKEA